jgi:hypothetical protein
MAREIIRRWKLAVLRAGLDHSTRTAMVATRLDGYASGSDVTYWRRTDPLSAFGLSNSAEIPTRVELPEPLVRAVKLTMSQELERETVLWLRLEQPYGYLGAAPWEDLAEDIDIPVLRVPDWLPTPTPLGQMWHVAMAVNASEKARWGAKHVRDFTKALREVFGSRVEVDVFADAHTHKLLLSEPGPSDSMIRVHDPGEARPAHERRSSESQSRPQGRRTSGVRIFEPIDDPRLLWADWIISGLAGRAVSALHIASPGVASIDRPRLAISPDPSRSVGVASCTYIETADLRTLADALGASLVSLAAPESRGADVGARMVADNLGQLRPGPTIYSSLRRDPGCRALAEAHAFVAHPQDAELPSHPSWFGYIQPESIQGVLAEPLLPHHTGQEASLAAVPERSLGIGVRSTIDPDGTLASTYRYADEVPTWVASSSRFLEAQHADLGNLLATPGAGKASKQAYDRGTSKALTDIESLLQRHIGEQ